MKKTESPETRARRKIMALYKLSESNRPWTKEVWHSIAHEARDLGAVAIPEETRAK